MTENILQEKILPFLAEIGISVVYRQIETDCFLPGLLIENGAIIIDNNKLKYPGDVLHEAAHIAVVPLADRATINGNEVGNRKDNAAEEMMAIAWSYAACVHLDIHPYFVFHEDGYQGGGNEIADNFMQGRYFGTPMLQWVGMTAEKNKAIETGVNPYPSMIQWIRQ